MKMQMLARDMKGIVDKGYVIIGSPDDVTDQAVSQFVLAAQRAAAGRGHAALISSVHANADPALALRKLLEHRVDGVLVAAPSPPSTSSRWGTGTSAR